MIEPDRDNVIDVFSSLFKWLAEHCYSDHYLDRTNVAVHPGHRIEPSPRAGPTGSSFLAVLVCQRGSFSRAVAPSNRISSANYDLTRCTFHQYTGDSQICRKHPVVDSAHLALAKIGGIDAFPATGNREAYFPKVGQLWETGLGSLARLLVDYDRAIEAALSPHGVAARHGGLFPPVLGNQLPHPDQVFQIVAPGNKTIQRGPHAWLGTLQTRRWEVSIRPQEAKRLRSRMRSDAGTSPGR